MTVYHLHGQGQRPYQEDTFFIDSAGKLFLVCDGVGGSDVGSVASDMVSQAIQSQYADSGSKHDAVDIEAWIKQLNELQLPERLEAQGIRTSTTLALLYLDETYAIQAHVGDSRVYHIRSAKQWTVSQDHSVVMDLMQAGIIPTEEEMKKHPQRNRITRAISISDQSSVIDPDIKVIDDVQKGDMFLVCSDGVTEHVTNQELVDTLTDERYPIEHKWNALQQHCQDHSRDNYTGILVIV